MANQIFLYDTTLRDGTQGEQVTLSAEDKVRIAQKLDDFGMHYVEGGWPGSNPKDARFFEMARKISFKKTRLTAFGSTRRPQIRPEDDQNIQALLRTELDTITVFGKSWDLHASEIMGVSLEENLAMIEETLQHLKQRDRRVIYDAEHFFDGYKNNPQYALRSVKAAIHGGADFIVLCDTNGGSLPAEIRRIMGEVMPHVSVPVGIHAHNDCGLALANALMAVDQGALMVQGTINGYGERCGNTDLVAAIGNLQIKMGYPCIAPEKLQKLTELSYYVSEVANIPPLSERPFVGKSAFAHKGGVHVSAIAKNPAAYEHIAPDLVGNRRRVLVSDLSGKSNIDYKVKEMGIKVGGNGFDIPGWRGDRAPQAGRASQAARGLRADRARHRTRRPRARTRGCAGRGGHVGMLSPTLQKSIGLGYVPPALAEPGTRLEVIVRGRGVAAQVVQTPFVRGPVRVAREEVARG